MYSEKTEIVDVVAVDNGFSLSKKAGDLYEAARNGDVIRRHNISDSPAVVNYAYVGLSEVKKDSSGFKFKFASGDEFTASDADAYPSASSVSDSNVPEDEPLIYDAIARAGTLADFIAVGEIFSPITHQKTTLYGLVLPDDTPDVPLYISIDGSEKATVELSSDEIVYDEFVGKKIVPKNGSLSDDTPYIVTYEKTSPALINLYDPDSSDTETYCPDGAYDSDNGVFVLDVSAAYERLKRGQNVWIRWYSDVHDGDVSVEQVLSYAVVNDTLYCSTWFMDGGFRFTNYTGE